jgi:hypothetical protein
MPFVVQTRPHTKEQPCIIFSTLWWKILCVSFFFVFQKFLPHVCKFTSCSSINMTLFWLDLCWNLVFISSVMLVKCMWLVWAKGIISIINSWIMLKKTGTELLIGQQIFSDHRNMVSVIMHCYSIKILVQEKSYKWIYTW